SSVLAGTFTVFGPRIFLFSGHNVPSVRTFSVLNPAAPYVLRVRNGGVNQQFPKVRNGSVSINGTEVISPQELHRSVDFMEKPRTLAASNAISVLLRGQQGSGIVVEVVGTDNDPPTITAQADPPPNANGWNRTDVKVTFTCADAISGIATCPAPVTVTTEGAGHVVSGTAMDKAGNTATTSLTLTPDKPPPTVQVTSPADGSTVTSSPVTATGTASDALSGVDTVLCNGSTATLGGSDFSCSIPLVEGNNTLSFVASDRAGNVAPPTRSVTLQPPGADTPPPDTHIPSPAAGSFVFQGRPPIALTYGDASGVDLTSVVLTANG